MSTQKRPFSALLIAGCAAIALAGCLPQAAQYDGSSKVARNEVHRVQMAHDLPPAADELAWADKHALARFLADLQVGYGDTVSLVRAPGFSDTATGQVAKVLRAHGVRLAAAPASIGRTPEPQGAVLVVDRYVVTPPQCPNSVLHATRNYENAPSPQFGCANVINLGQMVADPRHLLTGRSDNYPITDKAAQAIRMWRADQPLFEAVDQPHRRVVVHHQHRRRLPDFLRLRGGSGLRRLRGPDGSADRLHVVETWGAGDAIRPYGEWLFPYRAGATPYGPWGNPQGPWTMPFDSWVNPYGLWNRSPLSSPYPVPYGTSPGPYRGGPGYGHGK